MKNPRDGPIVLRANVSPVMFVGYLMGGIKIILIFFFKMIHKQNIDT